MKLSCAESIDGILNNAKLQKLASYNISHQNQSRITHFEVTAVSQTSTYAS